MQCSTLVGAALGALLALAPAPAQQPTRQPRGIDTTRTPPRDTAQRLDRRGRPRAARADTAQHPDTTAPPITKDPLTRFVESFSYRALGPAAYSGRVTAIAVPTPYHDVMYIGTAGGGVWKTVNGGTTWRPLGDSSGVGSVGDVAVAPSDTSVVWVGFGERNSLRSQMWGNGVAKSTDGGKTWKMMGLANSRAIGRIVIDPHDANTVYVAALGHLWGTNPERGVYKTTDGGATWQRVLFVDDTTGAIDLAMDPGSPSTLYAATWHRLRWGGGHMQGAGTGSGIWKSTDGGTTWTRLTDPKLATGLPTDRIGRIGLATVAGHPGLVFAVMQVDRGITNSVAQSYGGVFRSDDGGAHWTRVNDLQASPHYYYDAIVVDPSNTDHLYVLASPLLVSKDGGKSFAHDSLHFVHVDNHAMWIDSANAKHMVLTNDGGVYITRDGGQAWEHEQIPVGQFYTVIVDSAQTPYTVCGGLQDNGVWCGPSATRDTTGITDADWYPVNGGDGMWVQIPPDDPFTVYSEYQFGTISKVDLRTWKRDDMQPQSLDAGADSGYPLTWGWTTPLLLSQHDPSVLYVGANHLIRMSNGGKDWTVLGPDMTRADRTKPEPELGHTSYHAVLSIAESPRDAKVLWTGSDDGLLWLTRDGGVTWSNVTASLPKTAPTPCYVSTIAASYHDAGTAWVVFDCHYRDDYRPHIWKTADFGKTWTELVAGLPESAGAFTVFEDPVNPRLLWAGTETGVFVTVDGARRWRRFAAGLPSVAVERMAMSYATHDLVVSTHGRGIWVVNVSPLEEMSDSLLAEPAHLFALPPAYQFRYADTYPSFGSRPYVAPNPPKGASIAYWLKEVEPEGVKFVITTPAGDTVKHLTGPGYPGLQRARWDLTRDKPRPRELGGPLERDELKQVEPGEYIVRATIGKRKLEQRIMVREWPPDKLGRLR